MSPMNAIEKRREKHLKQAFGITASEWEQIFVYQGGVCFACKKASVDKRLSTDHCHDTGLLRGLLCHRCNALLGKIENNFKRYGLHKIPGITVILVLLAFAAYLQSPPATKALSRQVLGYPGKIGTKEYRKWIKRNTVGIHKANGRT